jgi:antitoxin YefM
MRRMVTPLLMRRIPMKSNPLSLIKNHSWTVAQFAKSSGMIRYAFCTVVQYNVHVHIGGEIMDTITYTSARGNLAKTMKKVCDDHSPVIITRKTENPVVMMSLEDYQALEETAYLLRSPKNAQRLLESIAQLEMGEGFEKELTD